MEQTDPTNLDHTMPVTLTEDHLLVATTTETGDTTIEKDDMTIDEAIPVIGK